MGTGRMRVRALVSAVGLAAALFSGSAVAGDAPSTAAAGCGVKFVDSNWDAPGDDNYMPQLNQEWVKIKNTCATAKSIGRWKIHDWNAIHTYQFPVTFSIGAGKTITLRTGIGVNSATTRYWGRSYGAVWNNTGTERAYLKNGSTTVDTWSER